MIKRILLTLFVLGLIAACSPVSQILPATPENTPEIVPSPTAWDLPTIAPAAPTAQPANRKARFGEPIAVGRGGIRDAAISPNRASIAIGWTNGISLTAINAQEEFWFQPTQQMVTAVDVSADHVAALLVNGDVWLFDAAKGEGQVFPGAANPDARWGDVAWSPDGTRAAIQAIGGTGAGASPLLILEPAAGEIRALPNSQTFSGWRPRLRWSPNGQMIAAADADGRAWVLAADTGEVIFRTETRQEGYLPVVYGWLPDSTTVIVFDGPGGLRLFDVMTGVLVRAIENVDINIFQFNPIFLSPTVRLALLSSVVEGHPYEITGYDVWDLETGKKLDTPTLGDQRHVNGAGCMMLDRIVMSFDGESLLYLDTDGQLIRWPLGAAEGEQLGQVDLNYPCLGKPMIWSPDSTRLVLETDPGRAVTVWDANTGEMVAERRDGTYPADIHGSLLAYRGAEEQLILWDMEDGAVRLTIPGPVTPFVGGIAFSPDGSLLVYGVKNTLHIADVATGTVIARLDAYPKEQQISHIRWSPANDALAASGGLGGGNTEQPGTTILWEREGGDFRESFRTETVHANYDADWANPVLFSPSGKYVALERMPELTATDQSVLVYDRGLGEVILERQEYIIQQWLSDEVLLATEAQGWSTFVEWNLLTGEERTGRKGGTQYELGNYAPDGVHHANDNGTSRIILESWRTGITADKVYLGADGQDVRFSPDGRYLAVRGTEGLVKIWPVTYSNEE